MLVCLLCLGAASYAQGGMSDAEVLEFVVREDSAVTSVPLSKLNLKNDLQIVCIGRNGNVITPGGNDTIEKGDRVIVITKHKGLSDLRNILK